MSNYVPPKSVHYRVLPHIKSLRMLTSYGITAFFEKHLPDVEDQDVQWYIDHYANKDRKPAAPKPNDPLFCAAMFMVGASLGELALLFNITRQTIYQKVCRRVNTVERQKLRDNLGPISFEMLSQAKEIFDDSLASSPGCYDDKHPIDIGRALISAARALVFEDESPDDPYSTLHTKVGPAFSSNDEAKELARQIVAKAQGLPPVEDDEDTDTDSNLNTSLAPLPDDEAQEAEQRILQSDQLAHKAMDELFGPSTE